VTDSRIVTALGGAPASQITTRTIAALVYCTNTGASSWILNADDGSFVKWGLLVSGGKFFIENDFQGSPFAAPANTWVWIIVEHTATGTPRWHMYRFDTAVWSHGDSANTVTGPAGGSATKINIGGQSFGGSATCWRGNIAVGATWNSRPFASDPAVEAVFTPAAADVFNASPGWMFRLNQASTATPVPDDTGGGGDQTSLTGTSVDTGNEPPGFDYNLTPPPPEEHDTTGTATATATATATDTTDRYSTGTAPAAATASATSTTARATTGTAPASATALAVSTTDRYSAGTATAVVVVGSYSAAGARGPRLISRRSGGRIVARARVVN
jgi:hypothetical protein